MNVFYVSNGGEHCACCLLTVNGLSE